MGWGWSQTHTPTKPISQGGAPAVAWVVGPGQRGMTPKGTTGMCGGEERRKGEQGRASVEQEQHSGVGRPCFCGDLSGLSKLSKAALTRTNVCWRYRGKIKGSDVYLLGSPSLYSISFQQIESRLENSAHRTVSGTAERSKLNKIAEHWVPVRGWHAGPQRLQ